MSHSTFDDMYTSKYKSVLHGIYITLHCITLKIFKIALVKTSRTTGRKKPNKLQYNIRTKLLKQMHLQFLSKHQ